jgi:hypothetical protein
MSQESSTQDVSKPSALSGEQLDEIVAFFQERLVGQPEVVRTLANVLYKQNALLKRIVEHDEDKDHPVGIPADPTVLLLMGGSWGKSLATRLIAMGLSQFHRGSFTTLTPLPQDPEGTLNMEPRAVAMPFATVVIENIESAQMINARFVSNLAHLLETGVIALVDPIQKVVQPVPLGLSTFIMTTSVADKEIRETLNPETRLGFLRASEGLTADPAEAYQEIQRVCLKALDSLPRELLRQVDETVVLRPLSEDDLRHVFDLEITHYQQTVFPGQALSISFEGAAKELLFDEARQGLGLYGAHALRRVLQRHIDSVIYRAYNKGALTDDNLEGHQVMVHEEDQGVSVKVVQLE